MDILYAYKNISAHCSVTLKQINKQENMAKGRVLLVKESSITVIRQKKPTISV